jgi:signal transduction histidine kinase
VLDQSLDSLCEQLREQHINIAYDLVEVPHIQGDELQLEQVFHNLLRNAVEAMPGGGTLRIASLSAGSDDTIEVRIQDSGPGIPEKDRDRIFQSFFTTKIKGTGLGLTIVQRLLENHGGSIHFERPADGGTCAVVHLPVKRERRVQGPDPD